MQSNSMLDKLDLNLRTKRLMVSERDLLKLFFFCKFAERYLENNNRCPRKDLKAAFSQDSRAIHKLFNYFMSSAESLQ